ncbi:alpha-L-fucosidase [Pararhodonellum marinum]|uniref:alpha-L-fucosidase n=1 Tax=Pararhodonellum marinum TaxID=2755358 RepID=UPI001E32BF50|nr:alpha-L-fucosidase [Pararhodonellum marinum]
MKTQFYFTLFLTKMVLLGCQSPHQNPPDPVHPIPSERQMNWQELEFYAFVHFNMNTFSDMEWGMGDESPKQFNPTELDTKQWARVVKEAGMTGIIITAKHHDGFCLWPSKYTEHSVKNAPWKDGKGDLIQELAESCKEYGLKMGIYYSPWDRNHAEYGQPEYLLYMRNQLTELLTEYGEVFEVWFDGANGGTGFYGGANEDRRVDKRSYYDWEKTIELVRELQPDAVIFGDAGPDVRWVGNEHGHAYRTTWSNLMRDSVYAGMPEYAELYATGQENGTHWVPAEADVSIRPGWYYHAYEDHKVKSLAELLDIYYLSIGQNASLLLNFPVDKRGLIHENDVIQIQQLSAKIKEDFAEDLALLAKLTTEEYQRNGHPAKNVIDTNPNTYWKAEIGTSLILQFENPVSFNRFLVQEHVPLGQRVKSFSVEVLSDDEWISVAEETTVGYKRILRLSDQTTTAVRFTVTDAKAIPLISRISLYKAPKLVTPPILSRNVAGYIQVEVPDKNVAVYYTIDGQDPDENSTPFEGPFLLEKPAMVKAISIDKETEGKKSEISMAFFDLSKAKWKVITNDPDGKKAIDEDEKSYFTSKQGKIDIDLGENLTLIGFTYLPMQHRYMTGIIQNYEFHVSQNGDQWEKVAEGEFGNIANSPIEQEVKFSKINARYIRLLARRTLDGQAPSFGEIGIRTE